MYSLLIFIEKATALKCFKEQTFDFLKISFGCCFRYLIKKLQLNGNSRGILLMNIKNI